MKVKLNISTYVGDELEVAGSVHELENGADLVKKGLATEIKTEAKEEKVVADAKTNAEIVAGLTDVEEADKEFLLEQLGDFKLELKVNGELNKKSQDKIDEIFEEEA